MDGLGSIARSPTFEAVGVWMSRPQIFDYSDANAQPRSEIVDVMHASTSYLSILGVRPVRGRFFTAIED